jgi:hypothetical protein
VATSPGSALPSGDSAANLPAQWKGASAAWECYTQEILGLLASRTSGQARIVGGNPLGAWCANATESLAMLLREGNAGANTGADHIRALTGALAQIPHSSSAKILVRVDGAGATHDLLTHLEALNTARRTVRYTVGWKIGEADEQAIAKLPETAWETSLHQDGTLQDGYAVT